jgi:SAM-dependent methyltransferase
MERADYTRLAHAGMTIMNPLPPAKLDEVLALLDLPERARVVDLGCGKGDLLARIVGRYDVDAVGIDRDAQLLAEAPPGIRVIAADIQLWDRGRGAFDLVASVGSPARLSSLAELVRPGGLVLYGDGYWRREPSAGYLEALGADADELSDYAGTIRRGAELGLTPLYAVSASVDDFDRYEWSWSRNGERYAAAHPGEPGVDAFLEWIRAGRRRYVELGGRETLGFGLFLFSAAGRVPARAG